MDPPDSDPLILAPTGFTRMAHSQGELAVARAAGRAGLPYVLSTLSTRSIEEVRAASTGDLWFQVYVWRDKELLAEMLQRADACEYSTIVITVDTAVLGRRERDVRSGFTLPPKIGLDTILNSVRVLHESFCDSKYRPAPLLQRMVDAGLLGRKNGQGFFSYGPGEPAAATAVGGRS